MKKLVLLLVMFLPLYLSAQKLGTIEGNKFEETMFNNGINIKFRDFQLDELEVAKKEIKVVGSIRVYKVDDEVSFYYRVKGGLKVPGVQYIGLKDRPKHIFLGFFSEKEIINIISKTEKMLSEVNDDLALNPEYLDNKLVTDSKQEVGYVVKAGEVEWYLTLTENVGRSIRFENGNAILNAFKQALAKIEELKTQGKLL